MKITSYGFYTIILFRWNFVHLLSQIQDYFEKTSQQLI